MVVASVRGRPAGCADWENLGSIEAVKVMFSQLIRRRNVEFAVEGDDDEQSASPAAGGGSDVGPSTGDASEEAPESHSDEALWQIFSSCGVDCYAKLGSVVLVNTAKLLIGQQRIDAAKLSIGCEIVLILTVAQRVWARVRVPF